MDLQLPEVELMLAVGSASAKTSADREVAGARPRNLESIYFDTADRKLRSAGYCLRLRKDRGRWSQTVKSENGAVDRYEHERRIKGGDLNLALLDETPVAEIINGADDLQPMFVAKVRRRSSNRQCEESRIEFSLDEGEIIAAGNSSPILELELELKSGNAADLFTQARRLAQTEQLTPAFTSKAERGYRLADGLASEPSKFQAPRVDRHTPAGVAFQGIARACLRQLTANAELLKSGARIEALHQVRVALRRLRVALTVFGPILADQEVEIAKQELRWLTEEMGDARNLDVFIFESFRPAAKALVDPSRMAAFGKSLLAAQQRAYARAAKAVRSVRFRTLLVEVSRWVENGEWTRDVLTFNHAEAPCREFAREALRKRHRKVTKRAKTLRWNDPLARHKLRIQIKKMRYASDFFADLAGGRRARRYNEFNETTENLQEILGRLNDIWMGQHVAQSALANAEPGGIEGADFAAGVVVGRKTAEVSKLIKAGKRAGRVFADTRPWW
jgi:inorganic triphosphatase YgiF